MESELLGKLAYRLQKRVEDCDGVAGVSVVDLATGGRIGVNDEIPLATASSIKIPILVSMYRCVLDGKLKATDCYTVEPGHHVGGTGVLQHLDHPASLALEDLATLMVVLSDNTATNLIIDLVGMETVNRHLDELGLDGIRLRRRMMDGVAAARGRENTATMRAAAELMRKLWAGEVVDHEFCDCVLRVLRKPKQQSFVAALLPPGLDIASKYGGMEGLSCDFAVVNLQRRPYVFCCAVNDTLDPNADDFVAQLSLEVYRFFNVLNTSTPFGRRLPMAELLAGDKARETS